MLPAYLQSMLQEGVSFAPYYLPSGNSDHLPMTLLAMHALGADEQQLADFRAEYSKRLQAMPHLQAEELEKNAIRDWRDGLGRGEKYQMLLALFQKRLETESIEALLLEVLPTVLPSIALGAFHPMIRLGYAVDFKVREEVAAGLACMVAIHRDMPCSTETIDLTDQLSEQTASGPLAFSSQRFTQSILELVEQGRYPVGSAEDFDDLTNVALGAYQTTRNFFALHLVTATQALRCALPDSLRAQGLSVMSGALLASHLSLQSPNVAGDVMPVPRALDEEHCLKYVWACLSESEHYGNETHFSEAEGFKRAGLVPEWVNLS